MSGDPMMTRRSGAGLVAAVAMICGATGASAGGRLAIDDPALATPATMTVSVPSTIPGGAYPSNYTADGRNVSPPASWTAGPPGTLSYAVVMQDADSPGASPAVHWLLYNLPPLVTALPRGMRNEEEPSKPVGALQGTNFHGTVGYSGPRPPVGDPPHHYHLQVFALNRALRVRPGAALADVERAMAGHVIARGELVVTYAAPDPNAPKHRGDGAPP